MSKQLMVGTVAVGGGAKNPLWRQIFADVYNVKIEKPDYTDEATSMGAAVTGGVGIGMFKSFDILDRFFRIEDVTEPIAENHEKYAKLLPLFDELYERLEPMFDKI